MLKTAIGTYVNVFDDEGHVDLFVVINEPNNITADMLNAIDILCREAIANEKLVDLNDLRARLESFIPYGIQLYFGGKKYE